MKKITIIVALVVTLFYAAALAIPLDPDEQRPGTRLAGNLIDDKNPDWSFMTERQKIYIQANTWYFIPHSVTTISFVADNELYVPCGWCASKIWPKYVAADPHVTVKVGDNIYRRKATKITSEPAKRKIMSVPEGEPTPDFELYRMDAVAS